MKNVLIACEESQRVCIEFRKRGFNAFSCDIQSCSGGHPEWHIKEDVTFLLKPYRDENMFHIMFETEDGNMHSVPCWDLIIAHPPCTYLSQASAVRMFPNGTIYPKRYNCMLYARRFFLLFYDAREYCKHVAIENPTPLKICKLPKPDQVIQPFYFGEPYSKRTCLWLHGLPPLMYTFYMPEHRPFVGNSKYIGSAAHIGSARSKTFPGIAIAMAEQWGDFINDKSS